MTRRFKGFQYDDLSSIEQSIEILLQTANEYQGTLDVEDGPTQALWMSAQTLESLGHTEKALTVASMIPRWLEDQKWPFKDAFDSLLTRLS